MQCAAGLPRRHAPQPHTSRSVRMISVRSGRPSNFECHSTFVYHIHYHARRTAAPPSTPIIDSYNFQSVHQSGIRFELKKPTFNIMTNPSLPYKCITLYELYATASRCPLVGWTVATNLRGERCPCTLKRPDRPENRVYLSLPRHYRTYASCAVRFAMCQKRRR